MVRYVLILALLLCFKPAHSDHIAGSEITYTCINGSTYILQVDLYYKCGSTILPAQLAIACFSACGDSLWAILSPTGPGQPVPTLWNGPNTCNTGFIGAFLKSTYKGVIGLPPCNDWLLVHALCCRLGLNVSQQTFHPNTSAVTATLNSTLGCNNSPVFNEDHTIDLCMGDTVCFDYGATDPDGDSLSYSLIPPLSNVNTNLIYFPPWSYNNFMGNSLLTFNEQTGGLCICPIGPLLGNLTQIAVFAILVKEWRNGVVIATTTRDIQVQAFECPTPLPVMLLDFKGSKKESYNYLKWVTASEINADHFNVERSLDAESFYTIGIVEAHGNSTSTNKYDFTDRNAASKVNYYRLRAVDYNGEYKYSDIISIYRSHSEDSPGIYSIDGRFINSDLNIKLPPGIYVIHYLNGARLVVIQ